MISKMYFVSHMQGIRDTVKLRVKNTVVNFRQVLNNGNSSLISTMEQVNKINTTEDNKVNQHITVRE